MIQIFISYSRKDTEFADQLEANLRDRNFRVWMDRSSIRGGELWPQSIIQGIETSIVVCVIVSENSLESLAVKDEIKTALASSKTIIPVIIDSSGDLSVMLKAFGLGNNQAIDFTSPGFDGAFQRLLDALYYWTFPKRVEEGLSHYNRRIRLKTVDDLSKYPTAFENQLVLNTLANALAGESEQYLARHLAILIGRFKHPLALDILIEAFKGTNKNLKPGHSSWMEVICLMAWMIQLAVIGSNDERVRNLLEDARGNWNENIRATASEILASLNDGSPQLTISPLVALLDNPDSGVKAHAATMLGRLGDARAIPYLKELLTDEIQNVRQNASNALEMLNYQSEYTP